MNEGHGRREYIMDELTDLLILDRSNEHSEPEVLYPFALEELLCRRVGEGGAPLVHLWRHPKAFVMGLRDSRLPGAGEASRWLEGNGYSVAVRNSGGAAVPLDLGVVNISLILPKRRQGEIDFRDDFERMYELIRLTLQETGANVNKGEVQGAYCPGDFDLSIGGRKFCGIAQRRQANAYVVQAFVVAEGAGREKAQLAREFYDRAASGGVNVSDHPLVTDQSMASLEELTGIGWNAAVRFTEGLKRVIRERQTSEGMGRAASGLWLPERGQVIEMIDMLKQRYGIRSV
ncbi:MULTISPECIES: lipoate--protein ligase family protein [unclassified Paenibacillus]|uniref:lipoyl protein ligase domain-containing protein n=1 Tax=unclassified Paenibacillus TaxID=185978 RepID=UPI001AE2214E|nr:MULTISPECIES: lipoate--protein ligase family protein [unclassified Paenibacillus]MBP1156504.1 octanoyl-[GcvH]:protein N-octanoyltransferase [Paenibacillus sp. PvP091]MBP1168110.1 octanoyl-[GcvH]:protein N-octanoyltransferase [Paenibacillus sp. PvR098]MBP2439138.1 octanoyl-[GcvH]:protein N-octanoyltransferase [Paenibacillus sp. PvP052]